MNVLIALFYLLPAFKNQKTYFFLLLVCLNLNQVFVENYKLAFVTVLIALNYEFFLKRFNVNLNYENYLNEKFFFIMKFMFTVPCFIIGLLFYKNRTEIAMKFSKQEIDLLNSNVEITILFVVLFLILSGFLGKNKWNG